MVLKECGNAHFMAVMSWAATVVGFVASTMLRLGPCSARILRVDFRQLPLFGAWGLGLVASRGSQGFWEGDFLHGFPHAMGRGVVIRGIDTRVL